jgi:hypothetical protein
MSRRYDRWNPYSPMAGTPLFALRANTRKGHAPPALGVNEPSVAALHPYFAEGETGLAP